MQAAIKSFFITRLQLMKKMAILGAAIAAFYVTISQTMTLGYVGEYAQQCLKDSGKFYLVTHWSQPAVGKLVAADVSHVEIMKEWDRANIVKYVVAGPGDTVSVTLDGVLINGESFGEGGLLLANDIGLEPEVFVREQVLGEDEWFLMGDTDESFDSRYWGTVTTEQVIGRAHMVFQ